MLKRKRKLKVFCGNCKKNKFNDYGLCIICACGKITTWQYLDLVALAEWSNEQWEKEKKRSSKK
jgi:hypothetical protein